MISTTDYEWYLRPKDVNWGPERAPPKRPMGPERAEWRCGNPKKRKKLARNFFKVSSVHGTAYICPGRKVSGGMRIVYRIFFCVCFLLLTVNVIFLVQESWCSESSYVRRISKDTSVGIAEDPDYFPTYPSITICRKPFHRTEFNNTYLDLMEYATLALGYPFSPLTPEELALVVDHVLHGNETNFALDHPKSAAFQRRMQRLQGRYEKLMNSQALDIGKYFRRHGVRCEELFVGCQVMMFSLNCCGLFQSVLTNMGICHTLNNTRYIEELQRVSPVDTAFSIDLRSPPLVDRLTEIGFHVFLTDPLEKAPLFFRGEGQRIVPGLVTTISAQLEKVDRTALYTSWNGVSVSCPTLHFVEGDRYTHKACPTFFLEQLLRFSCKCQTVTSEVKIPGLRLCDPVDHYGCMMKSCLKNNLTDFDRMCHEPCVVYNFRSDATYIGLGGDNMSRVEILYNSKQYIFHEHRTTTLSSLFSRLGGALGLYLGASIITVVEILVFVFSWHWHAVVPSRTNPRGQKPLPRIKRFE